MKSTSLAVILVFLLAVTATAATIDFTSSAFSGANNQISFGPVGPFGLTLEASPQNALLTHNRNGSNGIGVSIPQANEQDEIDLVEVLKISFDVQVFISEINLLKLYMEGDPSFPQVGFYSLNGGNWIPFQADANQIYDGTTTGAKTLFPNSSIAVDTIWFTAQIEDGKAHDYSVASMEVNAVPIPAAAWLLGTGLVGLVALRRRKR